MNKAERCKAVRAMDFLARSVNNEDILYGKWLMGGVADGDIDEDTTDEDLDYYIEDENFSDIMACFLRCMADAKSDGGLYIDGIVSK